MAALATVVARDAAAESAQLAQTAEHRMWPHPRAEMTDPTAIRLRLSADILLARALAGYIDADHALAAGWTQAQLDTHFVSTVNALAAEGRLPRVEKAAP